MAQQVSKGFQTQILIDCIARKKVPKGIEAMLFKASPIKRPRHLIAYSLGT
jgi:hypothetical protein